MARPGSAEAVQAQQEGWLKVQKPTNQLLVASLRTWLGAGEAEAIAIAAQLVANLLLMDEADGRLQARALGLKVTGTLGILVRAKQSAKLTALKPVLDGLIQQHNFRLARPLYEQALRQVGEAP